MSFEHCEAAHRWFIDTMVKSNAELTKQVAEEVIKDWDEILGRAIRRRKMDKMRKVLKKGENKDE